MKLISIIKYIGVFTLMGFCTSARAALSLTINSSAQTLSFSGTGFGNPAAPGGVLEWRIGPANFWPKEADIGPTISFSPDTPLISRFSAASDGARVFMDFGNYNVQTYAGNGSSISYAGFGQAEKDYLTALTNSDVLSIYQGSITQNILINAVPEPSSMLIYGLGSLLVIARRSRRFI